MDKVNHSVQNLICKVVDQIADDHEIEQEKIKESVNKVLKQKESIRCQGLVASKGNRQVCTSRSLPDTFYCRKHTPIECDEYEDITQHQCKAINGNNKRCIRNAKPGLDICGLHQHQKFIRERGKANTIPCIHYDENDDEKITYCGLHVPNEERWFCSKHDHLQQYYVKLYKTTNLKNYVQSVQDNTCVKRFDVIDNLIIQHGFRSIDTSIFGKTN